MVFAELPAVSQDSLLTPSNLRRIYPRYISFFFLSRNELSIDRSISQSLSQSTNQSMGLSNSPRAIGPPDQITIALRLQCSQGIILRPLTDGEVEHQHKHYFIKICCFNIHYDFRFTIIEKINKTFSTEMMVIALCLLGLK